MGTSTSNSGRKTMTEHSPGSTVQQAPSVQPASSRQWWWVLGGALAVALMIGTGWWWTQRPVPAEQAEARICDTYRAFVQSMQGTGLSSQAQRQYQTTKLIAMAQQLEGPPQANAEPVDQGAVRLQRVLNLPSATYREAYVNARPIAVYCGVDPRTGQVAGYLP